MLKAILVALFLLLLWAATLLLLPRFAWVPLLATAAVAAVLVVQRLRALKASQQIEKTLEAQADAQEKGARPDLQPEVQAMRAEFSKALAALKSSKLSRQGLSGLPWYLIIGPPGAGKSTALRNSGLKFPYLSQRGGVRGVGGTRNCEWWLTNEAVILDTAGRYTTGDEDREEWVAFLDTVARARPHRPINGVLLAVSVSELLAADEQGAAELGQRLRERVDELTSRLGMVVPVYVLLTKCDLLAGFVEMFGDLPRTERGQLWGFTLPLGGRRAEPRELFLEHFEELISVLEERVLRRLGTERRLEARERIYQFPRQLESLRGHLAELLQPVFAENPYQDTPPFRGLYFTSGTQEGRPIDRVMRSMADAFGVSRKVSQGEPATEARSYFLRDLFSEVLFRDQRLAVHSTLEGRRRRVLRLACAGGGLALAVLLLLLSTVSFFRNRGLLVAGEEAVGALKSVEGRRAGAEVFPHLVRMRDLVQTLEEHEAEGPPLLMRFGLYQGTALAPSARRLYAGVVRELVADPRMDADARELRSLLDTFSRDGAKPAPTTEDFVRAFLLLKYHLFLTGERLPEEPESDRADQEALAKRLIDTSHGRLRLSEVDPELLASHARLHVALISHHPELASQRRSLLVKDAREVLLSLNMLAQVQIQHLADRLGHEDDITLPIAMGEAATTHLKSRRYVPGLFTRQIWEEVARDWLNDPPRDSVSWVLGAKAALDKEEARQRLLVAYYRRYREEWRAFLESIAVPRPTSPEVVKTHLRVMMTGDPKPLDRLMKTVHDNVMLETPAMATRKTIQLDKLTTLEALDPEERQLMELRQHYEGLMRFGMASRQRNDSEVLPTPLGDYHQRLAALKQAFEERQGRAGEQAKEVAAEFKLRLKEQDASWQPWLMRMLVEPLEAIGGQIEIVTAEPVIQDWCNEVAGPFWRNLFPYFPFRKGAHDAPLSDFKRMYQPGGRVDGLYAKYFGSGPPAGGTPYTQGLLRFFDRSRRVRDSFFEGSEMRTPLHVQLLPVKDVISISLEVDAQGRVYRMGPPSTGELPVQWPGATSERSRLGAFLSIHSAAGHDSLEGRGEWGLFRLLMQAKEVKFESKREFTVVWHMPKLDKDIPVRFTVDRNDHPFVGMSVDSKGRVFFPLLHGAGVVPPAIAVQGAKGCKP